jgi:hypothetical protein
MTDDNRDISPAAGKARKRAYADTMRKLNGASGNGTEDWTSPSPSRRWTLPPHSEFDEFGFPVNGGDSVNAETNTPDPQSRISWRPSGRGLWRAR